jgi:thymidylate kinase
VIGKAIPDITFFLDIPIKEVMCRKSLVKKTDLDRIESLKTDFYERVQEGYLYLAEKEKRIKKIDGTLTITEIHKKIVDEIFKFEMGKD